MASRSSNRAAVPEAKSALDRFKYEVASEIGVPLKDGYNGDLTSRQNGSVGGYIVKKMIEAPSVLQQASEEVQDLLATDPELCEEENVNLQHYLEIFFEDQKSRLNL